MINNFDYKKYKALVKTNISKHNNIYTYKQTYHKSTKPMSLKQNDFNELILALEYLEKIGFVHGDINKKNIIYTNTGFKLIDYEPSLLQKINNKKQFMVTRPYISKVDLNNNIITSRTDKISFFYFLLRINGSFKTSDIVRLSKNLSHQKYLNMSEDDFIRLSYREILNYVFNLLIKRKAKNVKKR
nr:hypothetical protein [Sulfurimonas sp. SAG-AH-194-C20]